MVEVDIEVIKLVGVVQTIGVDVHERGPSGDGGVSARDHECGARHGAAHTNPFADATGQSGLPGSEGTRQYHKVTGLQTLAEADTEAVHHVRVCDLLGRHRKICHRPASTGTLGTRGPMPTMIS